MLRHVALRRVLIAALFAVLALVATGASSAAAATPSAERLAADPASWQRAYDVALEHWGHTPCSGSVRTTWRGLDGDINALAAWSAMPDAPASTFSACEISFNAGLDWDFATYCSVVVHEVGHLLGHDHNDEPGHIMSHVTTTMVPACGTAAAPRAPAAAPTATTATRAKRRSAACTRARASRTRRAMKLRRSPACRRAAVALRR
jgi:hypothetical protein